MSRTSPWRWTVVGVALVALAACGDDDAQPTASATGGSAPIGATATSYGTPAGRVGPGISDHWHAAYGLDLCGAWQPALPAFESVVGLHTHGDGVLHIHPFLPAGAYENATVAHLLDPPADETPPGQSGPAWRTDVRAGAITVSGTDPVSLADGDACPELDGRPGRVRWGLGTYDVDTRSFTTPFAERSDAVAPYVPRNGDVITIAFLPDDVALAAPPDAETRLLATIGAVPAATAS
jgi:hypothetical protein